MTGKLVRRGPDRDIERRSQQIKAIVQLGTMLRVDAGIDALLAQLVESVASTTGFEVAVLNLIEDDGQGSEQVRIAAAAGLSPDEHAQVLRNTPTLESLLSVMLPRFCISRSYFISHHNKQVIESVPGVTVAQTPGSGELHTPDTWHPDDMLLVPLISPRAERLMGILSLDRPHDGRIPTYETIEVLELFASQAAIAIDTARVFAEREHERQDLDGNLFELLYYLEQVEQGNLDVPVRLQRTALAPVGDALDRVLRTLRRILAETRTASEVVTQRASEMRAAAQELALSAQTQSSRVLEVARAIEGMAQSAQRIADTATLTQTVSTEATDVLREGHTSAANAADGMGQIREVVMQSGKKIKRLGESSQEIGEIVDLVTDFTNQTNMLALNAAIEAARAGEHGRGFAMVATEIRTLANSSAEATKQISARIRNIQTETGQVARTIDQTTEQVVLESELATQAGVSFEAADQSMRQIAQSITTMNDTATQQAFAAILVSKAMDEIAAISRQTHERMEQTRTAMDELVDVAAALAEQIRVFHLGAEFEPAPASQPLLSPPQWTEDLATQPMPAVNSSRLRPMTGNVTAELPSLEALFGPAGPSSSLAEQAPRPRPQAPATRPLSVPRLQPEGE